MYVVASSFTHANVALKCVDSGDIFQFREIRNPIF